MVDSPPTASIETAVEALSAARDSLETAKVAIMQRHPQRAADVGAVLACHRIVRLADGIVVLAKSGHYGEVTALGRSLLDAMFSAALVLDPNEEVRANRLHVLGRAVLELQLATANRV